MTCCSVALAAGRGGHLPAREAQESGGDGAVGAVNHLGDAGVTGEARLSCAPGPAGALAGSETVPSFTPSLSLGKQSRYLGVNAHMTLDFC